MEMMDSYGLPTQTIGIPAKITDFFGRGLISGTIKKSNKNWSDLGFGFGSLGEFSFD